MDQTSTTNHYLIGTDSYATNLLQVTGDASFGYAYLGTPTQGVAMPLIGGGVKVERGIHPELYFKYIKKKFGILEDMRLKSRLKKLEKAFNNAVDNGQEALGKKLLMEVMREVRESTIYAKGVKHFIERSDLVKHKLNIRGGHISDTLLKDFTRVIPKDVLAKKEKVKDVFDDFVIYHYWDEKAAAKAEKKQKMTSEEKAKMRDPVLFGIIRETDRLYFIADWEDEFCDLSFEELIDVIGGEDKDHTISREPKLNL